MPEVSIAAADILPLFFCAITTPLYLITLRLRSPLTPDYHAAFAAADIFAEDLRFAVMLMPMPPFAAFRRRRLSHFIAPITPPRHAAAFAYFFGILFAALMHATSCRHFVYFFFAATSGWLLITIRRCRRR